MVWPKITFADNNTGSPEQGEEKDGRTSKQPHPREDLVFSRASTAGQTGYCQRHHTIEQKISSEPQTSGRVQEQLKEMKNSVVKTKQSL